MNTCTQERVEVRVMALAIMNKTAIDCTIFGYINDCALLTVDNRLGSKLAETGNTAAQPAQTLAPIETRYLCCCLHELLREDA